MKPQEASAIGVIIGILYGVVLYASMDALSLASFILYGDPQYIPVRVSMFVAVLALVLVLSSQWWIKPVETAMVRLVEALQQEDELAAESWRNNK